MNGIAVTSQLLSGKTEQENASGNIMHGKENLSAYSVVPFLLNRANRSQ